jgi:hypothetical protein
MGQDGADGAKREVAAVIAYPAEYRSSGVMTFMVRPGATVYEKDLGANTAEIAGTMNSSRPTFQRAIKLQERT